MKRLLLLALSAILATAITTSAQGRFGVIGGMNFNSTKVQDVKLDAKAGWNLGATYLLDLPLGFSLQPSLMFVQKGADYGVGFTQKVSSIELPVSVQWGPDLIVARPFIDLTPYVGYGLSNEVNYKLISDYVSFKGKTAFEYGVGLGAGVNVWKLQCIVRYNWNFGALGSLKDFAELEMGDFDIDSPAFGGITVSLAFLF